MSMDERRGEALMKMSVGVLDHYNVSDLETRRDGAFLRGGARVQQRATAPVRAMREIG